MLTAIFWIALALLVFTYIGYPALAAAWASLGGRPIRWDERYQPSVSILIPAFNEANGIRAVLENKLAQDYPRHQLEILVVSDESTDGTDEIIESVASTTDIPVRLYRQTPRQGKTSGINTLATLASGEIFAFADANSLWANDALTKLVRNFNDPSVGYVTGKMVYTHEDGSLVGDGCSAYMKYENWLREQETRMGSVVGVDGGIDTMRARLFQPLRADQLPDFVQPLKVVEQGKRVIYEPEAMLKESASSAVSDEFAMRVRVTLRALWALKDMRHLMNPLRYERFAWQLISHKVLRYLAFLPLLLVAVVNIPLIARSPIYGLTAVAQVVFYLIAYSGTRRRDHSQAPIWQTVPYYFALLNLACAQAFWAFLQGQRKVVWTPRKG